ncbi:hypothetical protein RH858_16750, partial [Halalkaliarchaeum sp. AArc-GB]|uniref:hypothetical protein n=1 Tax=Halalkaliarchaeum sp. AArc-GB TaxID=3074078 RepID=UPI002860FD5D
MRPEGFGFEPGLCTPIHERADSISSTLQPDSGEDEAPDPRNAPDVRRQSGHPALARETIEGRPDDARND